MPIINDDRCIQESCAIAIRVRSTGRQTNWATVNRATNQPGDNQLGDTFRSTGRQSPIKGVRLWFIDCSGHNINYFVTSTAVHCRAYIAVLCIVVFSVFTNILQIFRTQGDEGVNECSSLHTRSSSRYTAGSNNHRYILSL